MRQQRKLVLFAAIVIALLLLVLEFWPQILRWIEGHLNWLDRHLPYAAGGVASTASALPVTAPCGRGISPEVFLLTRFVTFSAPGKITYDAGHKTVSADAGVPICVVLGHPELEPLAPREEHLPMRVADGAAAPGIGDLLYLVPRHVCPTVNNFDGCGDRQWRNTDCS